MTSENFVNWLNGFLCGKDNLTIKQLQLLRAKLSELDRVEIKTNWGEIKPTKQDINPNIFPNPFDSIAGTLTKRPYQDKLIK